MKISRYLTYLVKDWLVAGGCLTVIAAVYLSLTSSKNLPASLLWQIIIAASAFTFYKYALVNKHEPALSKKIQMISFAICYVLAAIMIVLWLWLFSPNPMINTEQMLIYITVILVVKGLVYAMMYIDGHQQAKQLNQKLSEYREGQ
ncbi:hypothetical protein [Paenibacillus macerans]|uniref:hypothetical protein n=1 Tax=Paenibacillus macerans TaxID=44252 RepID=UPI003D30FBEF